MASKRGVTVALDGFGAEQGFDVLAEGARLAAADGIQVRVFGPPDELRLDGADGIDVVATDDWIGNEEDPVPAVRAKEGASVVQAARDVADDAADAMVSLGSTGATMAAATFGLRRLKGVQRPALAVQLPVPGKKVLFLDVGANVEVRAQHLVQFAFLGAAFSEAVLDVRRPRVGLLTVGEEAGKGREEIVEAHATLSDSPGIDFVGNVEGRDLPAGAADVVVTDGFTGNVCLKISESLAEMLTSMIREELTRDFLSKAGAALSRAAFARMKRRVDYTEMGGAPLLGINGASIICHGASPVKAIKNALRVAAEWVKNDVNEHIKTALEAEAELAEGREGGRE